jgi:hypothetical protein
MCRWAAYLGEEVFLEDVVTAPCHSLIAQSHCAREAKSPTNGDGFGIRLVLRSAGARTLPGHPAGLVGSQPQKPLPANQVGSVPGACAGVDRRRNQPRQLPTLRVGPLVVHP